MLKGRLVFALICALYIAGCGLVMACSVTRADPIIVIPHTAEQTTAASAAKNLQTEPVGSSAAMLININTATAAELVTLNGIGEVLAERIIAYREEYGGFDSVDELLEVSGIGEKKFDSIKDYVTI